MFGSSVLLWSIIFINIFINIMKKHYIKITLITWVIYFTVWLIRMFVEWGYVNPFDWLVKIPYEDAEYRGTVVFLWIVLQSYKILDSRARADRGDNIYF